MGEMLVDSVQASDETLLRLIALQREDALAALYDRYSRLIFSVALHIVQDRHSAEEITLDVFTRVWDHAAGYQPELAKVTTWMTRMARNRAIDFLRRERVRPEQYSVSWSQLFAEPPAPDNPEARTELALLQRRVRAALAELPDAQRQVLALAYFRGLSHSQIAAALDVPLGTVKGRIRIGMQKLRAALEEP